MLSTLLQCLHAKCINAVSCFCSYAECGSTEYQVLIVMPSTVLQSVYAKLVFNCHVFIVMLRVMFFMLYLVWQY
jgi:hypothetical protein